MKKYNKGFTLVELIIVIAILAIIMLIAIPNFSGIQQRMQVRADKATAAQIGKAVRIWRTEYTSDPAFKNAVGSTVGTSAAQGCLPSAGNAPIQIAWVKNLSGYVDTSLVPTSLRTATGTQQANQYYYVGLAGSGTSEKIVVAISTSDTGTIAADSFPIIPAAGLDGSTGLDSKNDVKYDGTCKTAPTFKEILAYMEP